MRKTFVVVTIILSIYSYMYSAVSGNWGCEPLLPFGCQNNTDGILSYKMNDSLGYYIMIGAVNYLQSYSDFQQLMKQIELSEYQGLNRDIAQKFSYSALINMIMANDAYCNLYERALMFPKVKEEYLKKLSEFDYLSFEKQKDLIPSIFEEVREFLIKCNVHDVFFKLWEHSTNIMEKLKEIETNIELGNSPKLNNIWQCNNEYIKGLLFGQYVSMVMFEIIEK